MYPQAKFSRTCYLIPLLLMQLFFTLTVRAQHSPSDQLNSANWEIIGTTEFRRVNQEEIYAVFSPKIKKHINKIFELRGYMVPIEDGMKQSKFLLSTLPINQCFYCGSNGVPIMVMVEMVRPIQFSNRPIKIKGILKISSKNVMDVPPITLTVANFVP